MTITILSILFGLIISGLATYLAQPIIKKMTIWHWAVNLFLGALGAVAANQLLPGAYGPVIAGLSLVPILAGSLVLTAIGSWTATKMR